MSDADSFPQYSIDCLRENMHATEDEIDYVKRLKHLKKTGTYFSIYEDLFTHPSMIVDDFLYHGNFDQARNADLLGQYNIKHIITVCEDKLKQKIYDEFNVVWINLQDCMLANISDYFDQANELLESCRLKNEKVFVHCQAGVSRSATIVIAYLLKYHHSNLHDAYAYLLKRRSLVEPNDGFLLQLIRYEQRLKSEKHVSL